MSKLLTQCVLASTSSERLFTNLVRGLEASKMFLYVRKAVLSGCILQFSVIERNGGTPVVKFGSLERVFAAGL